MSAIPYIHGPNFKEVLNEMTGLPVEIENDANKLGALYNFLQKQNLI